MTIRTTFATDKKRPGSYLARVEVTADEPAFPDEGVTVVAVRKDGGTADVTLGKCVWTGPDGEKTGVDVALYTIAQTADRGDSPKKARQPPKRSRGARPRSV